MKRTLARMETTAVGLGAMVALGAYLGWGLDVAIGVTAGAAVGVANFRALRTVVGSMFLGSGGLSGKAALAVLAVLKFLALAGVVVAALVWLRLDRVGFVVGFTSTVAAVLVGGLRSGGDHRAGAGSEA